MRVGSLFSGIGGLDLGLERAGMSVVWQCERDPYARSILARRWPDIPCYEDVRLITRDAPAIDLLCGGFPCQPVSMAGQRQGTADPRWLWPHFAQIIRDLRPRFVLVENVPGLLTANGGDAMGEVLGGLAACGYDAEWDCIPAAAVGAPHRRDRVWIVAYPNGGGHVHGQARIFAAEAGFDAQREPESGGADVAHANGRGLEVGPEPDSEPLEPGQQTPRRCHADGRGKRLEDSKRLRLEEPRECGVPSKRQADPASDAGWWATEPDVGRVAHGVPNRVDRLRCLGNAVVPQVAEWIGRRIMSVQ